MTLSLFIARFPAPPHCVTALLDLQPTMTRTKDEPSRDGVESPINVWERDLFGEPVRSGSDHEAAMGKLMQILDGREAAFNQVREELKPERFLVVGEIELPHRKNRGKHGLWMEAEEMRASAACGLGWGVDLNVR